MALYVMLVLNLAAKATSNLCTRSSEYLQTAKAVAGHEAGYENVEDGDDREESGPEGGLAPKQDATVTKEQWEYIKRSLKSLRPIQFGVGRLYYMGKKARLTLIHVIINSTVNLLLLKDQ
jgi:hypothetical protein